MPCMHRERKWHNMVNNMCMVHISHKINVLIVQRLHILPAIYDIVENKNIYRPMEMPLTWSIKHLCDQITGIFCLFFFFLHCI